MDLFAFESQCLQLPAPLQVLQHPVLEAAKVQLLVQRDDLIHPVLTGNKWRKLKKYLALAQTKAGAELISFGGAYSNHLHALAFAAHALGLPCIGLVRGEELNENSNPFLQEMKAWGMQLMFLDRESYAQKTLPFILQHHQILIPEGGAGPLALESIQELALEVSEKRADVVYLPVGTGTTLLGLAKHLPNQALVGVLSLKNETEILANAKKWGLSMDKVRLLAPKQALKYGKWNKDLQQFCLDRKKDLNLPLEPIYSGKCFQELWKEIRQGVLPENSRILFLHTGGMKS